MFRSAQAFALLAVLLAPLTALAGGLDDQVKAAYAQWNAAFNHGDAKALGALYTEDALLLPLDHKVYRGPAGVEQFFGGLLASGVSGHTLELIEADDLGEVVLATAKWQAHGKDAQGAPATFGGLATQVYRKQPDGSLKQKLLTFN
ncbi:MAG: DUF4440 domain-containing protein [Geminicoccaceae bacterium]